jgi:tetratricopeptide (TPR) repeat protein
MNAIEDYNRAVKLDSNSSSIYYNRAISFMHISEYGYAFNDFNKVLKLDNMNANAYFYRGIAKSRFSNLSNACSDILKAIDLESISLKYDEADVVNDQAKGSETWGIANPRKSDDGDYFIGNVTAGSGKDKVVTDQVVGSNRDKKV